MLCQPGPHRDRLVIIARDRNWRIMHPNRIARIHGMDHLRRHVAAGGSTIVPRSYVDADGFLLGQFIGHQRSRFRAGKMPIERIQELESFPDWLWHIGYDDFETNFQRILAYARAHRTSRAPEGYHDDDGFRLGGYVQGLRQRYRLGRLTAAQIAQLESLPQWSWDPHEDDWNGAFQTLADHLATGGQLWGIPLALRSPSGLKVRTWLHNQQNAQRRLRNIHPDRVERLESLPGWRWSLDRWEDWYDLLQRFVAHHGHAHVHQHALFDGKRLGSWVSSQRQSFRRKQMKRDRIRKLESLPGWLWDASLVSWRTACQDLADFVDRFGHSAVPYVYRCPDSDFALGAWVSRLRRLIQEGTLTRERKTMVQEALAHETLVERRSISQILRPRRGRRTGCGGGP